MYYADGETVEYLDFIRGYTPASEEDEIVQKFAYYVYRVLKERGLINSARTLRIPIPDLLQQGMSGLLSAYKKLDPKKGKLTTFSRKPIYWEASKLIRRKDRTRRPIAIFSDTDGIEQALANLSSANGIEDFENQEELDYFKGIIPDEMKKLKICERRVIRLYYLGHLNDRQIGELVGLSNTRIQQIRIRALSKLRSTLEHRVVA